MARSMKSPPDTQMKLRIMQKVFKPTKKSLFGYDNYEGTEL